MKDYYALLGLDRNATKVEIKKNYRLLATKYHPDKNTDPDAATEFIAITEAYDILSNKKSRTQYDLFVWEDLKRKKNAKDDYELVVPPTISTRTRRNKAQQKRSDAYHEESSRLKKTILLIKESFLVAGRYLWHLLGTTLFLVILYSVVSQVTLFLAKSIIQGILICALLAVLFYTIVWIIKLFLHEIILDVDAFSVFYKNLNATCYNF